MSYVISRDGDTVYLQPPSYGLGVGDCERVAPDEERFIGTVMLHKVCNGFVDVLQTTETTNVILCRKCCLRVPIPADVRTWGDFRDYLAVAAAHVG